MDIAIRFVAILFYKPCFSFLATHFDCIDICCSIQSLVKRIVLHESIYFEKCENVILEVICVIDVEFIDKCSTATDSLICFPFGF